MKYNALYVYGHPSNHPSPGLAIFSFRFIKDEVHPDPDTVGAHTLYRGENPIPAGGQGGMNWWKLIWTPRKLNLFIRSQLIEMIIKEFIKAKHFSFFFLSLGTFLDVKYN